MFKKFVVSISLLLGAPAFIAADCPSASPKCYKSIHIAAYFGHLSCVTELIAKDETLVNRTDGDGRTPIFFLIKGLKTDENKRMCLKLLLDHGAKLDHRNCMRLSPLDLAIGLEVQDEFRAIVLAAEVAKRPSLRSNSWG